MYEDFPAEFEALRQALEAEDFERAEQIVLSVLEQKSSHQQAKYDLERIRGRMGSIENYVFRVNAFVDQGDLGQAMAILQEAATKFQRNAKIATLHAQVSDRLQRREQATAPASASASGGDELPQLQTFVLRDSEGEQVSPNAGPFQPAGGFAAPPLVAGGPKPWLKDDSGLETAPFAPNVALPPPVDDTGPLHGAPGLGFQPPTPEPPGAPPGGPQPSRPPALSRARSVKHPAFERRTLGPLWLDLLIALPFIAVALGGLLLIGTALNQRAQASQRPEIDTTVLTETRYADLGERVRTLLAMPSTSKVDLDLKKAALRALMGNGTFTSLLEVPRRLDVDALRAQMRDDSFPNPRENVEVVSVIGVRVWPMLASGPFTETEKYAFLYWVNDSRVRHGLDAFVPDEGLLATSTWDPNGTQSTDGVPSFGLGAVVPNTWVLVGIALAVAFIPGLWLGLVLSHQRSLFLSRLFEFAWMLLYCVPLWGIAFVAAATVAPGAVEAGTTAVVYGGALLGVALIPYLAFAFQQGFTNALVATGPTPGWLLHVLAVFSGLLMTAARMAGEGVVLLGVATLFPATAADASGLGSAIMQAFAPMTDPPLALVGMQVGAAWSAAATLFFWCVLLAVIAQVLQLLIAWQGLSGSHGHIRERLDHERFKTWGKPNLIWAALGLLGLVLMGLAHPLLVGRAAEAANAAGQIATGIEVSTNTAAYQAAEVGSSVFSLRAGVWALVIGLALGMLPALLIRRRTVRALVECGYRLLWALPPALLGLFALSLIDGPPTLSNAAMAGAVIMAPLAAILAGRTVERYRRGPYTHDGAGRTPAGPFRWLAGFVDLAALAPLLMAVALSTALGIIAFSTPNGAVKDLAGTSPIQTFGTDALRLGFANPDRLVSTDLQLLFSGAFGAIVSFVIFSLVLKLVADLAGKFSLSRAS